MVLSYHTTCILSIIQIEQLFCSWKSKNDQANNLIVDDKITFSHSE